MFSYASIRTNHMRVERVDAQLLLLERQVMPQPDHLYMMSSVINDSVALWLQQLYSRYKVASSQFTSLCMLHCQK